MQQRATEVMHSETELLTPFRFFEGSNVAEARESMNHAADADPIGERMEAYND